jgi:four helix bundle protein
MSDDDTGFAVKFRARDVTGEERIGIYQRALEFSAKIFTVVELAEVERYFLRDRLDRRSTAIPLLVTQALATEVMADRRRLFLQAQCATRDVATLLDVLGERGTVEPEALDAARQQARLLAAELAALTIPPPMVR